MLLILSCIVVHISSGFTAYLLYRNTWQDKYRLVQRTVAWTVGDRATALLIASLGFIGVMISILVALEIISLPYINWYKPVKW